MSDPSPAPMPPGPTSAPAVPKRKHGWLTRLLTGRRADDEIVVFHHSNLFYWWPVWLLGFIFAGLSSFDRLAVVPAGTVAAEARQVDVDGEGKMETRDVLILPAEEHHVRKRTVDGEEVPFQPTIHVSRLRLLGTIYAIVLLVVIAVTSLTVRGLWSIFLVFLILMVTIILSVAGVWGQIFQGIGRLSIYINQGGYLLISTALFLLWLLNFFIFDRQTYIVFTPGQVRVRLEIGGGETVYDTTGMVVQKQRADLFRHWVLGFGSGDLLIRPMGLGHALEMPNVLNVGHVVRHIEDVVKERVIVRSDGEPINP